MYIYWHSFYRQFYVSDPCYVCFNSVNWFSWELLFSIFFFCLFAIEWNLMLSHSRLWVHVHLFQAFRPRIPSGSRFWWRRVTSTGILNSATSSWSRRWCWWQNWRKSWKIPVKVSGRVPSTLLWSAMPSHWFYAVISTRCPTQVWYYWRVCIYCHWKQPVSFWDVFIIVHCKEIP